MCILPGFHKRVFLKFPSIIFVHCLGCHHFELKKSIWLWHVYLPTNETGSKKCCWKVVKCTCRYVYVHEAQFLPEKVQWQTVCLMLSQSVASSAVGQLNRWDQTTLVCKMLLAFNFILIGTDLIGTGLHVNPTSTYGHLWMDSCQAHHCKASIPYSATPCLGQICSEENHLQKWTLIMINYVTGQVEHMELKCSVLSFFLSLVCQLIWLVLSNNWFVFNNVNYLQVHGTAMETPMAPSSTNLFMVRLERELLPTLDKIPWV